MWAFLPIILNLFMVLGMLLAFYNSLDITKVLAFSVIISGFYNFFYFCKSKIFKNSFFHKKTRNNPSCKKKFLGFCFQIC